jgi:hypothetical protein
MRTHLSVGRRAWPLRVGEGSSPPAVRSLRVSPLRCGCRVAQHQFLFPRDMAVAGGRVQFAVPVYIRGAVSWVGLRIQIITVHAIFFGWVSAFSKCAARRDCSSVPLGSVCVLKLRGSVHMRSGC